MSRLTSTHPKTLKLNQKQRHLAKQQRLIALQWLAERFPEAFDNRYRIRPLKTGVMQDILTYADEALSLGISKSKLREAVVLYTRRIDYLTCIKLKEQRIDLNGKVVGEVTEEEAAQANQKIKKIIEKRMLFTSAQFQQTKVRKQTTRTNERTTHPCLI